MRNGERHRRYRRGGAAAAAYQLRRLRENGGGKIDSWRRIGVAIAKGWPVGVARLISRKKAIKA